jgi:dihydrodipicolinate synthase/N-acetylneuraminate lyase
MRKVAFQLVFKKIAAAEPKSLIIYNISSICGVAMQPATDYLCSSPKI